MDALRTTAAPDADGRVRAFRATDAFPTCFDDDPHWNPAGHRVAAEAIADAIGPLVRDRLEAGR